MLKRKIQTIITTLSLLLLFSACETDQPTTTTHPPTTKPKKEPFVDHVHWFDNLDHAFAQAKKTHKNIIVMVDSEGCRWCIRMEQESFNDPRVLKKFNNYIMVKVSREDPKSRSRLPEFKHVPIMFFYQWDGELIDNLRGFYQADDLLSYIQELEEYLE